MGRNTRPAPQLTASRPTVTAQSSLRSLRASRSRRWNERCRSPSSISQVRSISRRSSPSGDCSRTVAGAEGKFSESRDQRGRVLHLQRYRRDRLLKHQAQVVILVVGGGAAEVALKIVLRQGGSRAEPFDPSGKVRLRRAARRPQTEKRPDQPASMPAPHRRCPSRSRRRAARPDAERSP